MSVGLNSLNWSDVDPKTHDFDESALKELVNEALSSVDLKDYESSSYYLVANLVDRRLKARFGNWISGWNWTREGGGPVSSWCCTACNFSKDSAKNAEIIVAGVLDWRNLLEELDTKFSVLLERTKSLSEEQSAMEAASDIVIYALEKTKAEDAWYGTFCMLLSWFLERRFGNPCLAYKLASETTDGHFHSWCEPTDEDRKKAFEFLGKQIQSHRHEKRKPVDALSKWLKNRKTIKWSPKRLHSPADVTNDGHLAYINHQDSQRGEPRAKQMLTALKMARCSAEAGESISVELLKKWQCAVLACDSISFRSSDAYSHYGMERYGLSNSTEDDFKECIEQANDTSISPIGRAARIYLDICFFHPFPDGNSRLARLALDFVLTTAGLALHAADPVFVVARTALDEYGPYSFLNTIDYLAGKRVHKSIC